MPPLPSTTSFWHAGAIASSTVALLLTGGALPGFTQITPDDTLGAEGSVVTEDVDVRGALADLIEGGAIRDANLFHSFLEFNVDEGQRVYFDNPDAIVNIFSRVTGADPSNILGTLGVDGAANLFFLNPNGIIFGPNASLDIEGSFVGSTAESFIFPDGTEFSAVNPDPNSLLTVSVPLGLQYGRNPAGSTIANQGQLATGQNFTLVADVLDLRGQVLAGGDLTLHATDTLQIRDAVDAPFVAASMGEMLVQGDRTVDIFALNHPDSGLFSGGNMTFRSTSPVIGDARYWSGGTFQIEQSNGVLGTLTSPNDPVIRATGDVTFESYTGASLHIIAGGSVTVTGQIAINGVDQANGLIETIVLSDGSTLAINGQITPTLDIRAGTLAVGVPDVIGGGAGFDPGVPATDAAATSADISIGSIAVFEPNGLVFVSNQFEPNLALPGGTIALNATGVNNAVFAPDGGSVVVDARGGLNIADDINASSGIGDTGDIVLLSQDEIVLNGRAFTRVNEGAVGNAGNISITARSLEVTNDANLTASTLGEGDAGNISITASESILFDGGSAFSSIEGGNGNGGNITITTGSLEVLNGGTLQADNGVSLSPPEDQGIGNAGNITINASDRVLFSGQSADGRFTSGAFTDVDEGAVGNAGNIFITAQTLEVTNDAALNASTSGEGDAGNISITDSELILFDGGSAFTLVREGAVGNAGNIVITAQTLEVTNDAALDARTFGEGNGGDITIDASNSASFRSGSNLLTSVSDTGRGDAGSIDISGEVVRVIERSSLSTQPFGEGNGGDITIDANRRLVVRNADIRTSAVTDGEFSSGNILINANEDPHETRRIVELRGNSDFVTSTDFSNSEGNLGDAGNITIIGARVEAFDDTDIDSSAANGRGGDIVLHNFIPDRDPLRPRREDGNNRIDISSDGSPNGAIDISDPKPQPEDPSQPEDPLLPEDPLPLPSNEIPRLEIDESDFTIFGGRQLDTETLISRNIIDIDALIANSCVVPNVDGTGDSTFIITGPGGLPDRPGDLEPSTYPTGEIQNIPNNNSSYRWQPGDPIIEPNGVYQLPTGELILSHTCTSLPN